MSHITDPMHYLRKDRNMFLASTDWEMVKAMETDVGVDDLKTYRQSLRDLPSTASPELDSDGQLTGVTWPTKPE